MLQLGQVDIEFRRAYMQGPKRLGRVGAAYACVGAFDQRLHLGHARVCVAPGRDGVGHKRDVVEQPVEPNRPTDVVGVVAAGLETAANKFEIRVGLVKLFARDPVPHRDGECLHKPLVIHFLLTRGVVEQVALCSFLGL